jgi:hypothetical protein
VAPDFSDDLTRIVLAEEPVVAVDLEVLVATVGRIACGEKTRIIDFEYLFAILDGWPHGVTRLARWIELRVDLERVVALKHVENASEIWHRGFPSSRGHMVRA